MEALSGPQHSVGQRLCDKLRREVKAYQADKRSADCDFICRFAADPWVRPLLSVDELPLVEKITQEIWTEAYGRILGSRSYSLDQPPGK